ncbi:plastocyanin/azurin family copper-binding protein [Terasakiella sp. A23]|uniref:cupredoxin domain-containing protein n=1 Tax=Terasakiella sp. FCG-A23 TaxID=3080561 RepID=UPI002954491A|nr:plastocyanin/azurin family copper-binding protein [Terasakiella sp. A23]MDV7341278.1 plastocyanin/azurin family copper-binding protein [Terasakiella sp. A23]
MLLKSCLLGLAGLTFSLSAAQASDVCAKADARYEEIKGDLPSDEGVTVVKLYKYNFCPKNLRVKAGTTVRFVNVDKRTSHSVWLKEAGEKESARFFPDEYWEFPFIEKGTYPYLCGPHWEKDDMVGTITVE